MKKSIPIIFFFSSLLCCKNAIGQPCDTAPYRHIYYNKGFNTTQVKNFSFATNNDIYLIGYVNKDARYSNSDGWLMRTTYHGTPLWSKAIGTNADETISSVTNIIGKGHIFSGDTKYQSAYATGWLAKIDSSGNPLWSLKLNSSNGTLYQVEEMDNGDFVVAGTLYLKFNGDGNGNINNISHSTNFVMRIDKNGKMVWQKSFYHNSRERLNRVQQISDGNLIATGIVLDSAITYILKINQYTGDIIWMNQCIKPPDYNYIHIKENIDRSLTFKTGNRVYFFTSDGKFKTGSYEINLISYNKSIIGGRLQDVGPDGENEIYYANINPNPILFCVNNNAIVQWARIYNFSSSGELTFGGNHLFNNNIYLSGSYKAAKISDSTSNEQMAYLLKASIRGETFCSDTSDIAFTISGIPSETNTSYTWTDAGSVTLEFIPVYSKNIEPVRLLNCSEQTCCNDVAITKNDIICDNSSYKLPDGTFATKPGYYFSRMNTLTGCDSIIYTILSPEEKINLPLSSDTCLKDNKPVTFSLPGDSSVQYHWQDGTVNTQYTVSFPGRYWVTAVSACNAVTDSVWVHDNCAPAVFIPSAFTPNNDGLNDVFRIPYINNQHLENLNIYNRIGQLIFHSDDPYKGWDGTINNSLQPAGTYIYLLRYFDIEGKPHLLNGTLILIR